MYASVFAQDVVSPHLFEEMEMVKEERGTSVNLFLTVGYDHMANKAFSDKIATLGHTALPSDFMTTGFGFSLVRERWTILNLDINLGRATEFNDMPDFNTSLFFSHLKAGVGYNILDVQHQFRLEPGIGIVYGNGRYQIQPSHIETTFEEALGIPNFYELNLRQNNYGFNFNLTFSQNQFFNESKVLTNFFGLEVGTNLMLLSSAITPTFKDSPNFNLSTFYVKVKINVLSP
ncbi:hypothetical protein EL17_11780 [Anditalea andensis]|uniref:Uncharacterized protein n=2 Tax=Anditalea andensis TaxID=1048983 RepID=A0A074L153_9BACT|nr:hypothetical protein EL17_11780 [Anditalea andensis]